MIMRLGPCRSKEPAWAPVYRREGRGTCAIFSSGVLETQIGLFRSLEPGRYLVVMPDGDLPSVLAKELTFSSVKRNCVYSRESNSRLDPDPARRLGPDDVAVLEGVHPRLAKTLKSGNPVFGITKGGSLVTSCSVGETLDSHWEIGNVYTHEDFRRQGYGRAVVAAAVNYILDNGRVPVYECDNEDHGIRAQAASIPHPRS